MAIKIDAEWVRAHLWEILYAWERGAGNIISGSGLDACNQLVRLMIEEIDLPLRDPREGEWETSIAQIVERRDEAGLLNLIQWIATDSHSAAVALGRVKTAKKSAASRENGKKGGRPITKKRRG